MTETRTNGRRLELTSRIVSAYLSRNVIAPDELPYLIQQTYGSLNETSGPGETPPAVEEQRPAVPIKKSVTDDFIVCLEDGKKFKSLKRHLTTKYGMTPDQYREKMEASIRIPDDSSQLCPAALETRTRDGAGKEPGVEVGALTTTYFIIVALQEIGTE